jgi:type II restriction enzyme
MSFVIDKSSKKLRLKWINLIRKLNDFEKASELIEEKLKEEVKKEGLKILLDHTRLCSEIPEIYSLNSTQEKIYSKYTDIILSEIFNYLGFKTKVLKARGDSADVDIYFKEKFKLSFVADAKVFRASRTAKNAKDFKVQSMAKWKKGKPFALLVCPSHQLPTNKSQIYSQAIDGDVCILTFTHLAIILNIKKNNNEDDIQNLFKNIFLSIKKLNSYQSANDYWKNINSIIKNFSKDVLVIWNKEKELTEESIKLSKEIALFHYEFLIKNIKKLSYKQAIDKLIEPYNNQIKVVQSLENNSILNIK